MGKTVSTGHWNYEPRTYAMRMSMELRQQLVAESWERAERLNTNKQLRKSYWYGRLANAMSDLKHIDPAGWEAWFDSDAVPERNTHKELALLVEGRILFLVQSTQKPYRRAKSRLYRETFIWTDPVGSFIFREDGQIAEFLNEDEAKAYVDATLEMRGHLLGALV